MTKNKRKSILLACVLMVAAGSARADEAAISLGKPASDLTAQRNQANGAGLPLSDPKDFEDARKGLIAPVEESVAGPQGGRPAWTLKGYEFLDQAEAPGSAHPSLWRQARLNLISGLFKVTDRIYQVRGLDISNMTVIEGDTGLIIVDPLISVETAKAALELYFKHRPKREIVAVLYTHSHGDHFGGVKGVVSAEDVAAGKVKILAPAGFMEAAISENVLAGNAMTRRALYMYGALLPRGPQGQIDAGLGKTTSLGTVSLIAPTDLINATGDKRKIDGVEFEFQMAGGTEAPSEFMFYLPQFRVFNAAEVITRNMHNLYTIRGAEVRDARLWWKTIADAQALWGDKTDIMIMQHHWPAFGAKDVNDLMEKSRDLYKYLLDQSLYGLNMGKTPTEIAEGLDLPDSLKTSFAVRGYYGTVSHNAKAVYQKYLGWYDGNPANLNPLPPQQAGKQYVAFMGGSAAVIAKAKESFARGEYRWVAQVLNHVVFAEPENKEARALAADALEQLGYQAESAPWRNAYLMGAYELRNGVPPAPKLSAMAGDLAAAVPMDMIFDRMGSRLNAGRAAGKTLRINMIFPDTDQRFVLNLSNSALTYREGAQAQNADSTITIPRTLFLEMATRPSVLATGLLTGKVKIGGNPLKFAELLSLLDDFPPMFPIVAPQGAGEGNSR